MESESNQDLEKEIVKDELFIKFPFLKYIKGRLISHVDPETKKRRVGHVAMYYYNTQRLRIDWEDGLTTYHDFAKDTKWIFHPVLKKKSDNMD